MIMKEHRKADYNELYVTGEDGIKWHLGYYDHPLTGVLEESGEMHYFTWEYRADEVKIYKLSKIEKFKLRASHQLFRWMVGDHTDYNKNKDRSWYTKRNPEWLHNLKFKVFYSKPFVWLRKQLFTVHVPDLDYVEEG